MWILALIGAVIGGGSAIYGNLKTAEAQREQIKLQREAAVEQYKATEDSVNIMKGLSREATQNAILESQRAGAENVRQTQSEIKNVSSSILSQESMASGQSKGRQMATLYLQGNKLTKQTKDQSKSQILSLIEQKDQTQAQLNNELFKSYRSMEAVLSNEGPTIPGNENRVISGLFSGLSSGITLGNAYSTTTGPSTTLPSTHTVNTNTPTTSNTSGLTDAQKLSMGVYF